MSCRNAILCQAVIYIVLHNLVGSFVISKMPKKQCSKRRTVRFSLFSGQRLMYVHFYIGSAQIIILTCEAMGIYFQKYIKRPQSCRKLDLSLFFLHSSSTWPIWFFHLFIAIISSVFFPFIFALNLGLERFYFLKRSSFIAAFFS